MKKLLILTICCFTTTLSLAQQKEAQENKLVQFHMAVLKKGPKWDGGMEPAKNPMLKQHLEYFVSLLPHSARRR